MYIVDNIVSVPDAVSLVARTVLAANIRGMTDHHLKLLQRVVVDPADFTNVSVEYRRSFPVSCSLFVEVADLLGGGETCTFSHRRTAEKVTYVRHRPRVDVGWGSAGSSPVHLALANIALYTEVTHLAADIQATLDQVVVGHVVRPA